MIAENVEIRKLGDLCEVITKGTTPTSIGHAFQDEGINFVKVESLTENGGFIESKFAHISEEGNEALKRSQLKENDILFSIAGALGRTAIVTEDILPANTNQALAIIRLKDDVELDHSYLIKYLISAVIIEEIEKLKGGVAQQNLSLGQLKAIEIPIPPLPEQERIVAKLDAAFAAIDQAKANVEQNLHNAKELFQSKLNEVFRGSTGSPTSHTDPELAEGKGDGWVATTLGDICVTRQGTQIPKRDQKTSLENGYVRYLYISDFKNDKSPKYVRDEHPTKMVREEDLIVVNTGASAGDIFKGKHGVLSNNLFKVTFDTEILNSDYLFYFVNSRIFKDYQESILRGTANPHMGHKNFNSTPFFLPPIKSQRKMTLEIQNIEEKTDQLQTHYTQKLAELEELKKSLLERAFKGEI